MDYDKFVWDKFTLGSDQDISEIHWRGGYDPLIPPLYPSGPIEYFDVSIWATIAGQPDIGAGPLALYEMVANNEAPAGTFGGVPMYDYSFSLATPPFTPFHALAATPYWVKIGAFQPGVPGWCLASGSGGDGRHFASFVNYAGGTAYTWSSGDVAFTLLGAASATTTTVPSTTSSSSTTTTTAVATTSTTTTRPPISTTTTSILSSTTTTPPCTTARCMIDTALHDPECGNDAVPPNIRKKLDQATSLIERAGNSTPKKARRFLKQAKHALKLAGTGARKAAKGKKPKLTNGCATAIQRATGMVGSGLHV